MHDHPSKMPLVSQRISEILASISTSDKQTFLSFWMNKIFRISTSGMTSPASYRTHHSTTTSAMVITMTMRSFPN